MKIKLENNRKENLQKLRENVQKLKNIPNN